MEDLSAVLLFHKILTDAMEQRCTDVHLFPTRGGQIVVQFRVSGHLQTYADLPATAMDVLRRIKAISKMDVTESRLPQDGSFQWDSEVLSVTCDIRVATLPTIYGEAMVLRLFLARHSSLTFLGLGMSERQSQQLVSLLQADAGMVLVAGPTGSGKTTTLYSMMLQLASWGRKVVSIEDPVEMPLAECHQVEVRERAGVTFEVGLRALLRNDPDVIMIGEIRDEATAKIATRAALAGHLVLSTTHAIDIVAAAARIVELGASRMIVGDVMKGIIVQKQKSWATHSDGLSTQSVPIAGLVPSRPEFSIQVMDEPLNSLLSSNLTWHEVRQRVSRSANGAAP